jgi:hypothetical protein
MTSELGARPRVVERHAQHAVAQLDAVRVGQRVEPVFVADERRVAHKAHQLVGARR